MPGRGRWRRGAVAVHLVLPHSGRTDDDLIAAGLIEPVQAGPTVRGSARPSLGTQLVNDFAKREMGGACLSFLTQAHARWPDPATGRPARTGRSGLKRETA